MPMVVTRKDTGYFVRALVETAPGKKLLGVGSFISWRDYMKLWAKIQGVPEGRYREITVAIWIRWPLVAVGGKSQRRTPIWRSLGMMVATQQLFDLKM